MLLDSGEVLNSEWLVSVISYFILILILVWFRFVLERKLVSLVMVLW